MTDYGRVPLPELIERSETCPGRDVYFLKRRIASSFHIFVGNSKELRKVLSALADPESAPLRWEKNRREHDLVMREVGRLLHNYACSIESLGWHVRAAVRKAYPRGEFRDAYDSAVAEAFHSPFASFMQDLRDWVTHRGMLPFGDRVNLELDQGTVVGRTAGIVMDVADLRKWKKWNERSREFLESATTERFNVLELVRRYDADVRRFYSWLEEALEKNHHDDLLEFRLIVKEIGRRFGGSDRSMQGSGDERSE